ncbi:MAG: uroporphyrinogen decarboxylase [Bdellovibrionales bacterium]
MVGYKPILQVLNGKKLSRPPFWMMRQAGRYLPEYREIRAHKGGFLEMAFDPKAAAEVTLQPIRRFGMDAAIIFSDILTIPMALGQHLEFVAGEGPKLGGLEIDRLEYNSEILEPVYDALRETSSMLKNEGFDQTTLIGFCGAPWTVATYMVEGGGSKDYAQIKALAYSDPKGFQNLIDKICDATIDYLIHQVEAGAEVLQIFDSWAGALDPKGFQDWSIEPIKYIVSKVKESYPEIPIIGFPRGAAMHYTVFAKQTGIDAIATDSLMCTQYASQNLQPLLPVQGCLDPMRLLGGGEGLEKATRKIMRDFSGGPHIFNLGHGIHKETPISHVEQMVKILRDG